MNWIIFDKDYFLIDVDYIWFVFNIIFFFFIIVYFKIEYRCVLNECNYKNMIGYSFYIREL